SRITGYYRPVQNWNDGKSQEFKERKEYVIERSVLTHKGPAEECVCESAETTAIEGTKTLLFTTKTCPNCKIAAKLLDDAGVEYEKLYVEDNKELAQELGLKQVPALIVTDGENAERFINVVGVREFIARKGSKVNA
nr:ribonucleoside triphosphate reductase [Clostridia bacterium]